MNAFRSRGLSLFARELGQAAELAIRVGVLAFELYHEELLDTLIANAIEEVG